MARPPYPDPARRLTEVVTVRLTQPEFSTLQHEVEEANERAVEHGLPPTVTVASLSRLWLVQRLRDTFLPNPSKLVRPLEGSLALASHVLRQTRG